MFFYPPAGSELCAQIGSYLLRSGRDDTALRRSVVCTEKLIFRQYASFQEQPDQPRHPTIGYANA
jgi:hypothetical protein